MNDENAREIKERLEQYDRLVKAIHQVNTCIDDIAKNNKVIALQLSENCYAQKIDLLPIWIAEMFKNNTLKSLEEVRKVLKEELDGL